MKSFKDIKKFEDIDTYYNISELVSEIFVDRVEAHKHLVSANKEIERLNNNLKSLYNSLEIIDSIQDENVVKMQIRNLLYNYKELKGSDKDE